MCITLGNKLPYMVWQRRHLYRAKCPVTRPKNGDSCASCASDYPADCTYPESTGCPPSLAACDWQSLTWKVTPSSCNPPPDGGP